MPVEVPCPNCQAVLRAPDDSAGKRVKCKKCDHRFVIPGAKADSVGESQMLSVIEQPVLTAPSAPPAVVSPANAFSFDAGPSADGQEAPLVQSPRGTKKPASKGGSKIVLILGIIAFMLFLGCAGGGSAIYFLVIKPVGTAVAEISTNLGPASKKETKAKETKSKTTKTSDKAKETAPVEPVEPEPMPMPKVGPMPKLPKVGPMPKGGTPVAAGGGAAGKTFTMPAAPDANGKIIATPRFKIPLEIPSSAIKDIIFIPSNPPLVGVLWNSAIGFQGSGMKDTVDVYSARTQIRTDRFEYAVEGASTQRVFDLAPEGAKFASAFSKDKLYVHNLEAKAKLLDGFNPFMDAAVKRAGPPAAVRFSSPTQLLVFDSQAGIDVWDLATKQKASSEGPLSTSPGRVFVTEPSEGKLYVFAGESVQPISLTGQKAGAPIVVGGSGSQAMGIGLDAAGTRAAVAYQSTGKPLFGLAVLDLRKGGISGQLALPEQAGVPNDAGCFGNGAQAMIITNNRNNAVLYDTENDTAAAYLSAQPGKPAVQIYCDGVSGRICWVMPDPADPKKSLLLGVESIFDGYGTLVEESRTSRKPIPLSLRIDGLAK
jgi:predicted Zn finger-like uncharacterized protein